MIRNIFFDFDGVLAESVNVKTEAFRKLYAPFGEDIAEQVVIWHEANGGVSRFEKIRTWHQEFLGIQLIDSEINEWADRFSDLVLEGVLQAPWVDGAIEFINNDSAPYSKWIISGTPDTEMKLIAERRGIAHHFLGVHGSPRKKTDWATEILSQYDLNPLETVFIGDARSDFEASQNCGLHFILRTTQENEELFPDFHRIRVPDLKNLNNLLNTI
jgi:phosphoglycolate phosphatase-like HAD superfamily hydrolase